MMFAKAAAAAGSLALAVTPVAVSAAQVERGSAPSRHENGLFKDRSLLLIIATIAIVAGAIVLATNDDQPASP